MSPARIVLVEDNPADVLLIELALKENGISYELTRFATGEDAVQIFCVPDVVAPFIPDAILLDLNTPRSDGFQVLIKFKRAPCFANVPIAIITSSRAASDKHRSRLLGARLIEKPSQLEEFLGTVGGAVKEMLAHV
jgi:CheY-like chemotaxis protein